MSDEKTRVLTEAEAAGLVVEPPRFVNGKIVFFCPNGHRLVVADVHAGKRGRCDKEGCGVAVVIPARPPAKEAAMAPELAEAAEPAPKEPLADADEAAAGQAALPDEGAAAAADEAVADESATDTAAEDEATEAPAGEDADWQFTPAEADASAEASPGDEAAAAVGWSGFDSAEPDGEAFDNPTARLVARLWVERDHGGVVELHLTGGSVILPEWYESRWSRGTHGLFASQAPDGSITLTAVAWEAIQKVVVRQVQGLPDGMFE